MGASPQPDAEQRKAVAAAAKRLLRVASKTRLSSAAGIGFEQWRTVQLGLESLGSIEATFVATRRERFDAHSGDREFVKLVAMIADHTFGYVSPTIVCEVAALKVNNPDKTQIQKQVSEFKKSKV
jgi:hypothetical protein